MGERPIRVQLRRTKGWKLPPNTVPVTRGPGRKWGNPFRIGGYFRMGDAPGYRGPFRMTYCEAAPGYEDSSFTLIETAAQAVKWFRHLRCEVMPFQPKELAELRGKNLACFCALDQPCHADVLLELANAPLSQPQSEGGV